MNFVFFNKLYRVVIPEISITRCIDFKVTVAFLFIDFHFRKSFLCDLVISIVFDGFVCPCLCLNWNNNSKRCRKLVS